MAKTNTEWMAGKWGLMVHWLAPGPPAEKGPRRTELNDAVDHFDVRRFLADVQETGADWLIFTFGQNTGFYASPNELLDEWGGVGHCSRRDLALEIAEGMTRAGKRFIAYLPCEVAGNKTVQEAFRWNPAGGAQEEFQERYAQFVRAWAERFGKKISGWWFDGCYTWDVFNNRHMKWDLWFDACRAGNPESALAFNDGSFCVGATIPVTPRQDYLAGEVEILEKGNIRLGRGKDAPLYLPSGRFAEGTTTQWHALVPIDAAWAHGAEPGESFLPRFKPVLPGENPPMEPPVYADDELTAFLHAAKAAGGAVTFNVGISQEGHLGRELIMQLKRISAGVKANP